MLADVSFPIRLVLMWANVLLSADPRGMIFFQLPAKEWRRVPMFSTQPIGYVRSPYKETQEIPKGLGAKHEAEGIL
jgi:hypothetical protein